MLLPEQVTSRTADEDISLKHLIGEDSSQDLSPQINLLEGVSRLWIETAEPQSRCPHTTPANLRFQPLSSTGFHSLSL